jgi:hypothetical protein
MRQRRQLRRRVACLDGAPDAGPADASAQQCAALCGSAFTAQQQMEGSVLLTCIVSSCNTPSTCGQ